MRFLKVFKPSFFTSWNATSFLFWGASGLWLSSLVKSAGRFEADRFLLFSGLMVLAMLDVFYGKKKWEKTTVDTPLVCLCLWFIPVAVFSPSFEKTFSSAYPYLVSLLAFFLVRRNGTSNSRRVLLGSLWGLALAQAAELWLADPWDQWGLFVFPKNVNYTGACLACVFVMLAASLMWRNPWSFTRPWKAGLLIPSLILLATALVKTQSRGSMATAFIGTSLLVLLRFRLKGLLSLTFLSILIVLAVPKKSWITYSKMERDPHALGRLTIWKVAGKVVADSPWLGYGPGHFEWAYQKHALPVHEEFIHYGKTTPHAHSQILQWAAEWGLPGLGIIFWALFLLSQGVFRSPPEEQRIIPWVGLTALLFQSFFDLILLLPGLLVLAGILAALACPEPTETIPWKNFRPRQTVGFVLFALVLIFCVKTTALAFLSQGRPEIARRIYPFDANFYLAAASREPEIAESLLRKGGSLAPQDPTLLTSLARFLVQAYPRDPEKLAESLDLYERAIFQTPTDVFLRLELALFYRTLPDHGMAQATIKQALQFEPYFLMAHHALGRVFQEWGKDSLALVAWRQTLKLNQDIAKKHKGVLLSNYDRALLALDEAAVYHDLAGLYFKNRRYEEAREALRQALRRDPSNPLYQKNLRWLNEVIKPKGHKSRAKK